MIDTYTIQEIVDMAKCPIDRSKKLVFVEQARKELRKKIKELDIKKVDKFLVKVTIDDVLNES